MTLEVARCFANVNAMAICFDTLCPGHSYDRPTLAELWGYKSWAALGKGNVTPKGEHVIVLFITKEKQESHHQYEDQFDREVLRMEGEQGHRTDDRLVYAAANGDEVHLFYRERHHSPFRYEGRVELQEFHRQTAKPSQFVFRRAASE